MPHISEIDLHALLEGFVNSLQTTLNNGSWGSPNGWIKDKCPQILTAVQGEVNAMRAVVNSLKTPTPKEPE